MSKWILTTESPEESGEYLTISRYGLAGVFKEYGIPRTISYSKKYDAWNAGDDSGCTYKMLDLRDISGEDLHCVYAWCKPDAPTAEELDALERGVA